MAFDPSSLDPAGFNWGASQERARPPEALSTAPDMSSDEWDNPTAEPIEDIDAQLQDLAADSERNAVYLSPDQIEVPAKNPPGSVVIEDFDGKGGTLIARNQEVADKALADQTAGISLQEIIGGLTLAGTGKPTNPDAIVVQKKTPDGAVQRESVQATVAEAEHVGRQWGEGVSFTDMPSAVQRRRDLIELAAKEQGLSAQLVAGVMNAESGGINRRTSNKGAQGLMQLMPDTAEELGVTDVMDPEQNIRGGATYLRQMRDKYGGDREKMLAAYNWGLGNLDKHLASLPPGADWREGIPKETDEYIKKIGVGGTSEVLAFETALTGFRSATRESLNQVGREMQAKNIGHLEEGVFSSLDFQKREGATGAGTGQRISPQDLDPAGFNWRGMNQPEEPKGEYGWGIKNAFMRGLLRAGQLIDLAQEDWVEYAEGAEALKKYEVSEADQKRLEELQETDGFWDAIGYYITNPALAMQVVAESLPMSAPTLVGGVVGAVVAGPVGAMAAGGTGSAMTEYLASLSEAFAEHGVDATDPEQLKAAYANEEIMATARERAGKRAIGVGMFDALSMGLAGRIYKPIKSLAGAATKTGAVIGATTEIAAQGFAGAGGELSAQELAGDERDWPAVAGEFVGELVPGLGEMAISKIGRSDANVADTPDADGTPPISPTDEGGKPITEEEAAAIDAANEDVDIEAEAADQQVEPPPSEPETAATVQEEASSEVVEELPIEEMLAEAAAKEEAAEKAAIEKEEVESESTLIDTKVLGPKVTKTITSNKAPGPVRTAWRGLLQALAKRYPETSAKVPARTFTGTGVAKFFKQLQDDVDLTTDLPDLKAFLDEVTTGKPANVIQALDRLTSKVQGGIPSLTDAPIDSMAGQVQAVYNDFMAYFENAKTKGKGKFTKGKDVLKGTKIKMANKLGELSAAVRILLNAAEEAGVLEAAGIGANYGKTMELADKISDAAQSPIEKKTKGGGKSRTISYSATTLLEVANNLRELAEKVTPLLAVAEVEIKQWKADVKVAEAEEAKEFADEAAAEEAKEKSKAKAKVEETSSVTEAPAKPKKAEAAIKAGKKPVVKPAPRTVSERESDESIVLSKQLAETDASALLAKSMADLRVIAKKVGARTARSKQVVVRNILNAARVRTSLMETAADATAQVEAAKAKKAKGPKKAEKAKKAGKKAEPGRKEMSESAQQNMDMLLELVASGDLVSLAFSFHTVGHGVVNLTKAERAKIAKALGAKVVASVDKTVENMMAKAYAIKTKHRAAKAKKPDVKGAAPADVFDKEQNITGHEARDIKESVDAKTLDEAFEKAGVSKSSAKRIRGIMAATEGEQHQALIAAAYEYARKGNMIRFATQIEEIVGKVPSPELLEAYTEFTFAIKENAEQRRAYVAEEEAATNDDLLSGYTEDEIEAARATGALDYLENTDRESTTTDEWGVPFNKRFEDKAGDALNRLQRLGIAISKQMRLTFKRLLRNDFRVLNAAIEKIAPQLDAWATNYEGKTGAKPPTIQAVLELLLTVLPDNHRFTFLAKILAKLNLQNEVRITTNVFELSGNANVRGTYSAGNKAGEYDPANASVTVIFNDLMSTPAQFVKTLLHEIVHAATVNRYNADSKYRGHVNELWRQAIVDFRKDNPGLTLPESMEEVLHDPLRFNVWAKTARKEILIEAPKLIEKYMRGGNRNFNTFYGLTDPLEFIAESFTNAEFQNHLASIQVEETLMLLAGRHHQPTNLLVAFLNGVQKILGISRRNTMLAEIILVTEPRFNTQQDLVAYSAELRDMRSLEGVSTPVKLEHFDVTGKKVRTTLVNETADAARDRDSKLKQSYESLTDTLKGLPRAINLGFMNRDVIERNYRELFARASKAAGHLISPLTVYIKAKQAASQLAEKYALRATAALQQLQKLDRKSRAKIFTMMRDTTLAEVWPHVSLKDKLNAHLWSKPDKKGVSKLSPTLGEAAKKARSQWVALNKKDPAAAKLLIDMALLTKEIQDQKRILALRTVGKTYELDPSIIKKLAQLETHADIMKMFPGMYDKEGILVDADDTSIRPADTIMEKGDSKEVKDKKKKKLKEWKEIRAVVDTAEEIVKGTSINGPYFPLRRYGKYVVSSTEEHNEEGAPYVSFHHTRAEAKRVAAGIEKKHGIPTYVTKKIDSMAIPRDVESVTAELVNRMGTRKDGITDHMSKRLKAAMIEIMADNTVYASQLKRKGVDGVAADDMGRAFEEYVFVAKYTLGDLATSYEVHQALKDLQSLRSKGVQDILNRGAATEEEVLLIGDVVNELAAQNREDAKDREMSTFQKGVGLIGFFNFLGAPSYWILNATQTLTVTLPYIGSKWGAKGTIAYYDSAKTIFNAMAAAIKSGDKSYEGFKSKLPPAAQKVVAELEAQGIIQSTIAHQFGDIMTPSTLTAIQDWAGPIGKATATALKLMETIPEGVEKYNRISTALAIYNLSNGDLVAVADGVQATQFNYDSANRARLMKAAPRWAGGGLRAIITPMMMFKSYGIGITRLLYGSMIDIAIKKGGRVEAMKLAGGLIVTHTVFGGVAGGIMMAPVQGLVSVFNAVFREAGDEFDPEEAIELYLQDVANDTVAALVARGIPAAVGVDMSKSINLGNLIWMGNDRINLGDAGGVETMITTALGPVAQYAITTVREGARIWNDDPRADWYDFVAAAIPLKMARGTIRGLKYEMKGVGTDTLTFIEPEDVTGWIRLAMGFRPTNIAMTTDFEYNLMGRDARRSKRKSSLIDRALRANTAAKRAAVWEEIESFNYSLDKRSDWIRRGNVARLKSGRRSRQRQHDRERR